MSSNTITLSSEEGNFSTTIDASNYLQSTLFYLPDGQVLHPEQILPTLENESLISNNEKLNNTYESQNTLYSNSLENVPFFDTKEEFNQNKVQNEHLSILQEFEQTPTLYQQPNELSQENNIALQETQLVLVNQENEEIIQPIYYLNYTFPEDNILDQQEMQSLLNYSDISDLLKVKPRSQEKSLRRTQQIGETMLLEQKLQILDAYLENGYKLEIITKPLKKIECKEEENVQNDTAEKSYFYQCDLCNAKFSKEKQYYGHIHLHTNERQFNCQICLPEKINFNTESQLRRHEKMIHGPMKIYRKHHCNKCEASFIRLSQLKYHQRRDHMNEKNFSCQVCKKKFFKRNDLKTHLITHLGIHKAICEICGRKFNHISNYIRHSRLHSGIKPYPCTECGGRFYQVTHLNNHKCISRNVTQKNKNLKKSTLFSCPFCKKQFKYLRIHIKMAHSGESLSENTESVKKKNNPRKYYCNVCGETFQFNCQLRKHEFENHKEENFTCSSCLKIFLKLNEFKKHECLKRSTKRETDNNRKNVTDIAYQPSISENNIEMENLEENNRKIINCHLESNLEINKGSLKEEINNQQTITETTKSLAKFIQDFEYFPLLESSESNEISEFNSQEKSSNYPDDYVIVVSQNNEENQQMPLISQLPPTQESSLEFNYMNINNPSFNQEEEEYDSSNSLDPLDFLFPRQENNSSSAKENNKQNNMNNQLSIKSHSPTSSSITKPTFTSATPAADLDSSFDSQNKSFSLPEKSLELTSCNNEISSKEIVTEILPKELSSISCSNQKTISPISHKKNEYPCSECSKIFSKRFNLQQHLGTHFPGKMKYNCKVCEKRFAWWTTYQKHLNLCPGQPLKDDHPQLLSCRFCEKKYKTKEQIRQHEKTDHQYLEHVCKYCSKRFFKLSDLNYHIRIHTKEKPFLCPFCGKGFNHVSHVKRHERIHTGEKPYQCEICGRRFSQTSTLHSHKKIHSEEKNQSTNFSKKISSNSKLNEELCLTVICPTCNKPFKKLKLFNQHIERCTFKSVTRFLCEICNATFAWKNCLLRHLRVQHKIIFEKIKSKKEIEKEEKENAFHTESTQPAQPIENFLYDSLQYYLSFNLPDKVCIF